MKLIVVVPTNDVNTFINYQQLFKVSTTPAYKILRFRQLSR